MYKIFERIKDFILIFDATNKITFCNQSLLDHLGYDSLAGTALDALLIPNTPLTKAKEVTTQKFLLTLNNALGEEVIVYTEDQTPLPYHKDQFIFVAYPYEDIFYTKKHLEQILDHLPFNIWLKNDHSEYIYVNQKYADWLQANTCAHEFLGQPESTYWDDDLCHIFNRSDSEVISTNREVIIPEVIKIRNKDVYWQTYKIPFSYNQHEVNAVLGTTFIPIDTNQLEVSLIDATRRLNLLYEATQVDVPDLTTQSILQRITSMITHSLDVPALSILTYNEEDSSFVISSSSGLFKDTWPMHEPISISRIPIKNILSSSQRSDFIDLSNKEKLNEFYSPFLEMLESLDISYLNQYYIKDNEHLLGIITIGYTSLSQYTSTNSQFVEMLSNQIYGLLRSTFLLEQSQIEKKRRMHAEKQAIQLEKAMAIESMKNEFFINISHELKTPINILLSTHSLLSYFYNQNMIHVDDQVDLPKYLGILKQNSYRLLRLITNLIDMTKIEAGQYRVNLILDNIVNLIEETTLSITSYSESKNIDLIFDTEVEECLVLYDPEKIECIMLNLLSNAVKYTPAYGHISVYITATPTHIRVSVKDTGIGIPSDKTDLIFKRFGQVDMTLTRPAEGSGIGLSIVNALLEMHQGHIWVESTLGEGSEFIFEIPLPPQEVVNRMMATLSSQPLNQAASQHSIEKCDIEFSDIYY